MIFHRINVEGPLTRVTICPLGDIQWNGEKESLAFGPLQRHIQLCLTMPNPIFLGMGDYIDFASPSNRAKLAGAQLYAGPRRVIDQAVHRLVDEAYHDILKPTKGMWGGLVSGHHLYPLQSGGNSDTKLCEYLEAPYLGFGGAIVQVQFSSPARLKRRPEHINIWMHHGEGAGIKVTSALAKLENISVAYEDVDVFLMGHQTKKSTAPILRLRPEFEGMAGFRFTNRDVYLVTTGGWEKGYLPGTPKNLVSPSYVEQAIMTPTALGAALIHVRPYYHDSNNHQEWRPNIRVEV